MERFTVGDRVLITRYAGAGTCGTVRDIKIDRPSAQVDIVVERENGTGSGIYQPDDLARMDAILARRRSRKRTS